MSDWDAGSLITEIYIRYPKESAQYEEPRLLEMLQQSLAAARTLEITARDDVFRYAALRVLITPQQRASTLIRGAFVRIIGNLKWTAAKRLDFIYKHIVGRAVPRDELELGAHFVPAGTAHTQE